VTFHAVDDHGGSCGRFGADAAGGTPDKVGKNSGAMKVDHTSYSGPNWRRKISENERSKINTGSKITVPM